jgi:hypothetical protein
MENLILSKISKASCIDEFTHVLLNSDKTQSGDKYYRVYLTDSKEEEQLILQFDKRILTDTITETLFERELQYSTDSILINNLSFNPVLNDFKFEIINKIRKLFNRKEFIL